MSDSAASNAGSAGDGGEGPKKKRVGRPFEKGDSRINRTGRTPMSDLERAFRHRMHSELTEEVFLALKAKLKARGKADAAVVNKLVDKLGGADAVNVKMQVEKEVGEFLATAKAALSPEEYEKLATAFLAKGGGGEG